MTDYSLEQRQLIEWVLTWQSEKEENFATRLFALIDEADRDNRRKLKLVYPEYFWAFELLLDLGPDRLGKIVNEVN